MVFRSPGFIREEVERTDAVIRAAGYRGRGASPAALLLQARRASLGSGTKRPDVGDLGCRTGFLPGRREQRRRRRQPRRRTRSTWFNRVAPRVARQPANVACGHPDNSRGAAGEGLSVRDGERARRHRSLRLSPKEAYETSGVRGCERVDVRSGDRAGPGRRPVGQPGWLDRGRGGSRQAGDCGQLRVISGADFEKYRATLAPDYVLLEHGELQDVDDEENMNTRPAAFRRTDAFDFKSVEIEGTLV